MNEIIYISSFLPKYQRKEILSRQKIYDGASCETLSYAIFKGLAENIPERLSVINIPPVGPFPTSNRDIKYSGGKYIEDGVEIQDITFSTLLIYQHYDIFRNIKKLLKRRLNKNRLADILLYSINPSVLKALLQLKKDGYKFHLTMIIPDFWDDMLEKPSLRNKIKSKLVGNVNSYYSICDAFVYLTEYMKEKTKVNRPYCVVEGMYNTSENRPGPILKDGEIKTAFYSGMLHEKFGVGQLVRCFHQINDDALRLKICGSGEFAERIKEYAAIDNRIIYLGLIDRQQVLEEQYNADVLVNPRSDEGLFTKYSFPSKTIEYFSSGTPALIHRLPGIPEEYYDYCFTFDDNSDECITRALAETLRKASNDLLNKGKAARNFILDNKNAHEQTKKIIKLIDAIA